MSSIDHVRRSTTPRTAREAFGSDFYPPRPQSRWRLRLTAALLILVGVFTLAIVIGGPR